MGELKDKALEQSADENVRTVELTEQEMNYIRLLNLTLQYHTHGQKIVSGFLYYVATNRLGYTKDANLQFKLDLSKEDRLLTIQLMPATEEKEIQT